MPHKPKSLFIFLVAACVLWSARPAAPEVVDKIIVVVNDEIITQGEVDKLLLPVHDDLAARYENEELAERLDAARRAIMERLIQDRLLLSEAKKRKIEVTNEEVQAKIEEAKKRFASDEEFKMALAHENLLVRDLEKKYRERLMIDKVVDMELRKSSSVSPSEVFRYYESHPDEFVKPAKVKPRSILIRFSLHQENEARRIAEGILARLKEGGDFELLAKEYSEGPYSASGGDMGWVQAGELMSGINEAVFALNENEISGIVQTNLGLHIFKVEEKIGPQKMEFSEAKNQIEQRLFGEKIEERLSSWLERLKKNAYIAFK